MEVSVLLDLIYALEGVRGKNVIEKFSKKSFCKNIALGPIKLVNDSSKIMTSK